METGELEALLVDLRAEGSDTARVEVKAAAGGLPEDLAPTLSAFANIPGGGTLLLGVDERAGFEVVGVYDAAKALKATASIARQSVEPPVVVEGQQVVVSGGVVVVVVVHEAAQHAKPIRVRSTGRAYLRSYDGDYVLSQVEEQTFVANRSTPSADREAVAGTGVVDLDERLLRDYVDTCRGSSSALAAMDDPEVLFRTGVLADREGELTTSGLLALGVYPQQHLPNCVIQASTAPGSSDAGARADDVRRFDGPLPLMLDDALRWVQRSSRTRVEQASPGSVRDRPEYPLAAVRELLSNALIHRDLGAHAQTQAITLRLDDTRLTLSNPGGLWGISLDRLGRTGVTSARNGQLLRICQHVRTRSGGRVVEALATGIPTVLRSLQEAGMVPPSFHDQGVSFTVLVPNHALLASDDLTWLATLPAAQGLDDRQRHALVAMRHGRVWTNQTFRSAFPMDSREATQTLLGMVSAGVAVAEGERGGRTYAAAPGLAGSDDSGVPEDVGERVTTDDPPPRRRSSRAENGRRIVEALRDGPSTSAHLSERTGLTPRQLGYALAPLRLSGEVRLEGGPGVPSSRYVLGEIGDAWHGAALSDDPDRGGQ